jgi:alkylation response protein AidB-like acyl-CoA dehydrogenase
MSDENNTPNADELREQIRAEIRAEFDAHRAPLDKLIADEIASAPESIKKLIPETLPPAEQVAWLRKAKASGAFAQTVPATDSRRPNNAATTPDAASLSPIARIATGYKTSK